MKKRLTLTLLLALLISLCIPLLAACEDKEKTLYVYNWEDYIDRSVIDAFESQNKVKVKYLTFDTNETMMTNIEDGKQKYDLVCPSDYAMQQMIRKNLLEEISTDRISGYTQNVSAALDSGDGKGGGKFDEFFFSGLNTSNPKRYAIGYMWGVMGVLYNVNEVKKSFDDETIKDLGWNLLMQEALKNKIYMKDSVRDTFAVYTIMVNRDNGFTSSVKDLLKNQDASLVEALKQKYRAQVSSVRPSFEVDEAKSSLTQGDHSAALMWGGDAYSAMEESPKNGIRLDFLMPDEGNNIFCDGFVIPKDSSRSSAKLDLIYKFINFISLPENALKNMAEIGYTSVISGDNTPDNPILQYATDSNRYGIRYPGINGAAKTEVNFFFGPEFGEIKVDPYLYPSTEYINEKCAIMYDYGEATKIFNDAWTELRGSTPDGKLPGWGLALIIIGAVLALLAVACFFMLRNKEKVLAFVDKKFPALSRKKTGNTLNAAKTPTKKTADGSSSPSSASATPKPEPKPAKPEPKPAKQPPKGSSESGGSGPSSSGPKPPAEVLEDDE